MWYWRYYVVFIFSNSLTPADLSSEESGFVMRLVHQAIGAAGLSAPWLTEHVIRKYAHFSEYTLLWNSAFPEHEKSGLRRLSEDSSISLLIFLSRLWTRHYSFSQKDDPVRISDVWLDMSGAVTGTILYACICFLISGS